MLRDDQCLVAGASKMPRAARGGGVLVQLWKGVRLGKGVLGQLWEGVGLGEGVGVRGHQ